MTATIIQRETTYGPYAIIPNKDFDQCGLDKIQLYEITHKAMEQGAEIGYCDVVFFDDDGKEIDREIAII